MLDALMDLVRDNPVATKLLAMFTGLAIFVAGASPQTPDSLTKYLTQKGYSEIVVLGRSIDCGGVKRKRQYDFRATSPTGETARGTVCMADYWFGYRLNTQ